MKPFKNFKKLRIDLEMSQIEMAESIGVNRVTISGYETGRKLPSIGTAHKIIKLAHSKGIKFTLEDIYPAQ